MAEMMDVKMALSLVENLVGWMAPSWAEPKVGSKDGCLAGLKDIKRAESSVVMKVSGLGD